MQLALGLLAGFVALHFAGLTTSVSIPFSHAQWHLGTVGFYVLVFLVIAGASNTVNLTDGLDGLAAGSAAAVLVAYAGVAFIIGRHLPDPGILDLSVLSTCIVRRLPGLSVVQRASRPTSSWVTPARWVWAGRSPAWPSSPAPSCC